ncbi:class I SAM-dependent methyltransferase [Paenibacillus kyungheensis]
MSEQVARFYQLYDEDSRFERPSRAVEYITTIHIVDTWLSQLPPVSSILDSGAGSGAYAIHYAKQGHQVKAIDITPKHIQQIQAKSLQLELNYSLQAEIGNATTLSTIATESLDMVLCLGPYYHLTSAEDRASCLSESMRVLRPGGILIVAYINKYSIVPMLAVKEQGYLRSSVIDKVLQEGVFYDGAEDSFWTDLYVTSPEQMEQDILAANAQIVDHAGADGVTHTIDGSIDHLEESMYQTWLDYHLRTCRERSILGLSTHGIIVGRKSK